MQFYDFKCADCSSPIAKPDNTNGGAAGYASLDRTEDGPKICYACAAIRDRADMIATGRATLYLTGGDGRYGNGKPYTVTNWPASLTMTVWGHRTGRHNIAGKRYDVWFNGPDGHVWHGVQFGDNTQIVHCRRTKEKTEKDS